MRKNRLCEHCATPALVCPYKNVHECQIYQRFFGENVTKKEAKELVLTGILAILAIAAVIVLYLFLYGG